MPTLTLLKFIGTGLLVALLAGGAWSRGGRGGWTEDHRRVEGSEGGSMKFTDLNPHWFVLEDGGPRVGLTFDCPHCRETRLAVAFHHHGREAMEDQYIHAKSPSTNHIWQVDGADFADISLSPSVDASERGHWHGFITNGEVT